MSSRAALACTRSPLRRGDRSVAGVIRHIKTPFTWVDTHWVVPKDELLGRTEEWNNTLACYLSTRCDLSSVEQAAEARRHAASPLAPCANPTCTNKELEVKGFRACSRCLRVSHCSASVRTGISKEANTRVDVTRAGLYDDCIQMKLYLKFKINLLPNVRPH